MRNILVILISLFAYTSVQAQFVTNKYIFENLGIANGLSQSTVNGILQDKKGFIWISTQDGLNRYDGYNFKIYRPDFEDPKNSLISGFIDIMTQDNYGNLVIRGRGNGGLTIMKPDENKFYHFTHDPENPNSIPNNAIYYVHIGKENDFWLVHESGFTHLHFPIPNNFDSVVVSNSDTFLGFTIEQLSSIPYFMAADANKNLYFIYDSKFYFFEANRTDLFQITINNIPKDVYTESIDFKYLKRIGTDKQGHFWIMYEDSLVKYLDAPKKRKVVYNIKHGLSKNFRNDFYVAQDSCLYAVTGTSGLVSVNLLTKEIIYIRHDPRNNKSLISDNITSIMSMFEDNNGNLWIGTSKYNRSKNKFTHIAPNPGNENWLQDAWPFCFAEDLKGNIWVGTYFGKGIYIYDKKKNIFKLLSPTNPSQGGSNSDDTYAIHRDIDGNMWVSNGLNGLGKWNEKTGKFIFYLNHQISDTITVESNIINAIDEDSKGNLWLATAFGIQKFDRKLEKFTTYPLRTEGLSSRRSHLNFVQNLLVDGDSTIWVGGGTGFFKMTFDKNGNAVTKVFPSILSDSTTLSYSQIFTLYKDSKGYIWVGTFGGGLNKFDPKTEKFVRYSEKKGLANNVVYGMLEDDLGRLWISTNSGISELDPASGKFMNYTINHGLQSNEFNQGAYFKDSEGIFYFGGVNGFNMFYPTYILTDTTKANVVLTDFKLFNQSVLPGQDSPLKVAIAYASEIRLNYWQRDFTFEFASTNFASPLENTYAYMIENYHDDWIMLGKNHTISFTGFPYGDYVLKIKTANADGIWSDKITSIRLIITPPFWKTIWFQILVVLSIIGLVVLYFQMKARALKRDKIILERKVKERTAEIVKQKNEILEKNEELRQLNEEISTQRDSLKELNDELTTKNEEIQAQNEEIEEKNTNITASILYAQRIQKAVIPSTKILDAHFQEHFVYFKPRDIVSGDFYFARQVQDWVLVAAADCTGHGVPGAFMSMLGLALLNEIARNPKITAASDVLNELREQIKLALQQTGARGEQQDGMDIAFCAINTKTLEMSFSGAHNPCVIFTQDHNSPINPTADEITLKPKERKVLLPNNKSMVVLEADHMPVGIYAKESPFTEHTYQLVKGDVLYLYTDGYYSQFGGEKNEKFKTKRFHETLTNIHVLPIHEQKTRMDTIMRDWQKTNEQVDDILVIGISI